MEPRNGGNPRNSDRYNGLAEWYDSTFTGYRDGPSARVLEELLGQGDGVCLDTGCGGGLHFAAIESTGRRAVGLDYSLDQLRVAASRGSRLVQGDASRLPFAAESVDAVVSTFTHTDVPEFRHLLLEAARVLRSGGILVYVGTHPCFVNHAATRKEHGVLVAEGYSEGGWHAASAVFLSGGLRSKVGEFHLPLADFLMAFISSGLRLTDVREVTDGFGKGLEISAPEVPGVIAVMASKGGAS
jgi:SAM-dependent methyltransferase